MEKILDYHIIVKSNNTVLLDSRCYLEDITKFFKEHSFSDLEDIEFNINDNVFRHVPTLQDLYMLPKNNPRLLRDLLKLLEGKDFVKRIDFDVNDWQSMSLGGDIFLYSDIKYENELSELSDKIEALYNVGSSGKLEGEDYRLVGVLFYGEFDTSYTYYKGVDF